MRIMVCDDLLHDARKGQPGWQPLVGYRSDVHGQGPPVKGHGALCRACSNARGITTLADRDPLADTFLKLGITYDQQQRMLEHAMRLGGKL